MGDAAGFELLDQCNLGLFVLLVAAEMTALHGLTSNGVIEGFDGEGE